MSRKSIIPVNLEFEEFEDPDKHFKSLPYYDEIPQLHNFELKIPPWPYGHPKYMTCREKMSHTIGISFFAGWYTYGRILTISMYGLSASRWRLMWNQLAGGILAVIVGTAIATFHDPACCPYNVGRGAPLYPEQALRHALNAKYDLYSNIDRIMYSTEKISKHQFYSSFKDIQKRHIDDMKETEKLIMLFPKET